jgi:hypothetical protein
MHVPEAHGMDAGMRCLLREQTNYLAWILLHTSDEGKSEAHAAEGRGMSDLNAESITDFHDRKLAEPGWPLAAHAERTSDAWHWLEANHRYNSLLWNEEDRARRTDVGAEEIAAGKRLIDQYNQKRNDATEAIDEVILNALAAYPRSMDARLNSETAGSMIDRLSILSLKIHHMRKQTLRTEVDGEHIRRCEAKLARLVEQREDLGGCFDALLVDARLGIAYFKVYRQFKMYNDPSLNPCLYGTQHAAARAEP